MSEEEKVEAKSDREVALEAKQKELSEANAKREGKGTRLRVGQTRGKNPQIVVWEAFDEALPATLPASVAEFLELTGIDSEPVYLAMLIDGYNSAQYTAASDPIAEFVNAAWEPEMQKNFRLSVRNYATAVGCSIDDAVALIKPGIEKAFAAKAAPSA